MIKTLLEKVQSSLAFNTMVWKEWICKQDSVSVGSYESISKLSFGEISWRPNAMSCDVYVLDNWFFAENFFPQIEKKSPKSQNQFSFQLPKNENKSLSASIETETDFKTDQFVSRKNWCLLH